MEVKNGLNKNPLLRRSNSLQLRKAESKDKSECRENLSFAIKHLESNRSCKKSKIAEVLELCLQPRTKVELGNILFNFWERLADSTSKYEDICGFDGVCMFALDYIYEHGTSSFVSISRSLFVYDVQNKLVLKGTNKNLTIKCDCILNELQKFTDLHTYSNSEEMLVNVGLGCIFAGNLGLALYLVKFGLVELPSVVNEKCKKMIKILVEGFNSFSDLDENRRANLTISVRLDELLNHITEKEVNIKKSILIFCILVIAAEYRMYEKLEAHWIHLKFFTKHKKDFCLRKLNCVDLFTEVTTESVITFKDIESFAEVFLNPFITADVGNSLVETSRKILSNSYNYYNPRSLKNLSRFKVRSSLRYSMTIPEAVNQLEIPVALKDFLLFHSEGIWNLLILNHLVLSLQHKLNSPSSEIENGNERELVHVNDHQLAHVNDHQLAHGNVRELEVRNVQIVED